MTTISLCVADETGPGCGAELPRAGTNLEHLDHDQDCRSRAAGFASAAVRRPTVTSANARGRRRGRVMSATENADSPPTSPRTTSGSCRTGSWS